MRSKTLLKIEEYIRKGHRFIGLYEGSAFVTTLDGDTIVDAIEYFYSCYNSTLNMVYDSKENEIYKGRENDEPDVRGYFNYSYYDEDENLIYNQDEKTAPVVKLKAVRLSKDCEHGYINRQGKFYKCGFEAHRYLARELFFSKTYEKPAGIKDAEDSLDKMGWVRISSKRINFTTNKLTLAQKKSIRRYMEIMGDENYMFMYGMLSKDDVEIRLNEKY